MKTEKNALSSQRINGFCRLIFIFMLCSIIGWIWEEAYCLIKHGFWVERGFLFGPLLPIYGFGGMSVYLIKEKLIKNPFLLFPVSFLTAGIIEYVGHFLLEKLFDQKWWDYTGRFLNINGRVHVIGLLFFATAGCLAAYFVIPPFMRLIDKGNKKVMSIIAYVLFSLLMTDTLISSVLHFIK